MARYVIAFALTLIAVLFSCQSVCGRPETNAPAGVVPKSRRVDVEEFDKLRRDKQNVLLDVRTKKEFEAGHIPGAINLDIHSPDFEKRVSALDTNKLYLVHCAAGVRSARACQKMEGMGFGKLIDLAPGFKGWEKAGKPVEK